MLIPIPDLLTREQLAEARQLLDEADWVDGRVTAGHQSARSKNNMQLRENSATANQLGEMILASLGQNALFISAARVRALVLVVEDFHWADRSTRDFLSFLVRAARREPIALMISAGGRPVALNVSVSASGSVAVSDTDTGVFLTLTWLAGEISVGA